MNNDYNKKLKDAQIEILDFIVDICNENNLQYSLMGGTLLGAIRHKGFIPWDDDIDLCMPREDYEKFIKVFPKNDKFILDDYSNNKKYWLPFLKIRNSKTIYKENLQTKYSGNCGIWVDIFPMDNADKKISFLEKLQFIFTGILRSSISLKSGVSIGNDKIIKRLFVYIFVLFPKSFLFKFQKSLMTFNKNDLSQYIMSLGSQYGYKKQIHLRTKWYPCKLIEFEGKRYCVPNDCDYVLKNIYGENYMVLPPVEKRITHNPYYVRFEDGEEVFFDEKI